MPRSFYPPTTADRLGFWASLGGIAFLVTTGIAVGTTPLFWVLLVTTAGSLVSVYVFQSPRDGSETASEHADAMRQLEAARHALTRLDTILKSQSESARQAQEAIARLREESAQLKPVVQSQRETVQAILGAHAKATARAAWKERAYGFAIGITTSAIVSYAFLYIQR